MLLFQSSRIHCPAIVFESRSCASPNHQHQAALLPIGPVKFEYHIRGFEINLEPFLEQHLVGWLDYSRPSLVVPWS
jgi:hypothetical protein